MISLPHILSLLLLIMHTALSCDETGQCSCQAPIMDCLNAKDRLVLRELPSNISTLQIDLSIIDDKFTSLNFSNIQELLLRNGSLSSSIFETAVNVHTLTLQEVSGHSIVDTFKGLSSAKTLNIFDTNLSTFSPQSFQTFNNLTRLHLKNVTGLMENTLAHFQNIQDLWLHYSQVPAAPFLKNLHINKAWFKYITFNPTNTHVNSKTMYFLLNGVKQLKALDIDGMNAIINEDTFEPQSELESLFFDDSYIINVEAFAFKSLKKLRFLKLVSRFNRVVLHKDSLKAMSQSLEGVMIKHFTRRQCDCEMMTALYPLITEKTSISIHGSCYSVQNAQNLIELSNVNETDTCLNSTCVPDLPYSVCLNEIKPTSAVPDTTLSITSQGLDEINATVDTKTCENCIGNDGDNDNDDSDSTSLIIGFVVACCIILLIGSCVVWYCARKRSQKKETHTKKRSIDCRDYGWKVEDTSEEKDKKSVTCAIDIEQTKDCSILNKSDNTSLEDLDNIPEFSFDKKRSGSLSTLASNGTFFFITSETSNKEDYGSQDTLTNFGKDEKTDVTSIRDYDDSSDLDSDLCENNPTEDDGYADVSSCTESYLEPGTSIEMRNRSIFNYLNSKIVREFPDDDNDADDSSISRDNVQPISSQSCDNVPVYENFEHGVVNEGVDSYETPGEGLHMKDADDNPVDSCASPSLPYEEHSQQINMGYLETDDEADTEAYPPICV